MAKNKEKFNNYDGFVEKFKPKKTTDDCYTPPEVYDVVLKHVRETYNIADDVPIVRPFYPGGDYENYDYPEGCVVVDNPPFSIFAKILDFYQARGIRFFLFAPHLTGMCATLPRDGVTFVCVCYSHLCQWRKSEHCLRHKYESGNSFRYRGRTGTPTDSLKPEKKNKKEGIPHKSVLHQAWRIYLRLLRRSFRVTPR